MRIVSHLSVLVISLCLIGLGSYVVAIDSDAFLVGGDSSVARVAKWTDHRVEPGLSIAVENANLLDCANVMSAPNSLELRYLDDATRAAIAGTCLAMAEQITSKAPAASYAWLVGALALSRLADIEQMNTWLLRSQQTGPNERWIAEKRIELAEAHFADLGPEVAAGHDLDLLLVAQSTPGTASIARRYFSDPAFRERLITLVESLPGNEQARFVAQMRSEASNLK